MSESSLNNANADIELLSRFMDGELDLADRDALEARLEAEPALAAKLATLRQNDALLAQVFNSGPATRIPAHATVALADRDNVVALPFGRRFAPLAAAASLVLGIGAVLMQLDTPTTGSRSPAMDAMLASALETLPSRADGWDTLEDGSQLRAVLTFPAADGKWCREFLMASDAKHWRGVACRDDDTWVTQVMGSEVFLEQATQYRTAGAGDSEAVARFIDETATDVALGPQQEQALIASDWQSP
jgi:hypothetical protein